MTRLRKPVLALLLAAALGLSALGAQMTLGQAPAPGKVHIDLTVQEADYTIMGVPMKAWTFNGMVPGPIIRITQGTTLEITLQNAHTEMHSLHTHFQDYDMSMDGTSHTLPFPFVPHQADDPLSATGATDIADTIAQSVGVHGLGVNPIGPYIPREDNDVAPPGTSYTYTLQANEVGVFLYHCHVFPVEEHIGRGLFGLIIVYPPGWSWEDLPGTQPKLGNTDAWVTDPSGKRWYEDDVILSDLDPSLLQEKVGVPLLGSTGKIGLLNFRAWNDPYYLGPVQDGTPMRVVVANIGSEIHSWHVHGHNFDVLDKFDAQKRVLRRADTLVVAPGESYETTLVASHPGFWFVHDHINPNAQAGMIGWLNVQDVHAPE
jgi:FtsP/CotA-like multicopper oxidase with cupredoxin domain